jgi:hypothetical protein
MQVQAGDLDRDRQLWSVYRLHATVSNDLAERTQIQAVPRVAYNWRTFFIAAASTA